MKRIKRAFLAPPSAAITRSPGEIQDGLFSGIDHSIGEDDSLHIIKSLPQAEEVNLWHSLRRHYPDQVTGSKAFGLPLSLAIPGSPSRILFEWSIKSEQRDVKKLG
jgi:hypothetical protein